MGRDQVYSSQELLSGVSTHAPAWGAIGQAVISALHLMFQLTRPHGARFGRAANVKLFHCFNSRARMGRDILGDILNLSKEFQLTRPHGARCGRALTGLMRFWFQLTRPHGARYLLLNCHVLDEVSTHAPAWGAIPQYLSSVPCASVSTHAPAWGAIRRRHDHYQRGGFNSRARMGRDPCKYSKRRRFKMFQLTRPHGAR